MRCRRRRPREALVAKGPKRRNFAFDALQVLSGQFAMMAIGIVNGVIMARWLGPADRGRFALLVLLPTMLSNFVKLGIPQASVYYMRRRGASASDVASNSVWFAFVTGTLAAIVCYVFKDFLIAKFLKDTPPELILPSLALIPFVTLQFYFLGVAQAQERFRDYNVWQIGPNVLALVGLSVTLILLHMGLVGAVLVQVVIQVVMTVWMAWLVNRAAPLHLRWNGALARGMLSFGSKSYVQTLAATLHLRIDQYICAYFLPPAQVGLYSIAVNFGSFLLKIPEATGTVMFPRPAGQRSPGVSAAGGLGRPRRACGDHARLPLHAVHPRAGDRGVRDDRADRDPVPLRQPLRRGRQAAAHPPARAPHDGALPAPHAQLHQSRQAGDQHRRCVGRPHLERHAEHLPHPALRHLGRRARQRTVLRHRGAHAAGRLRARFGPLGGGDAPRATRRDRGDRARRPQDGRAAAGEKSRVRAQGAGGPTARPLPV